MNKLNTILLCGGIISYVITMGIAIDNNIKYNELVEFTETYEEDGETLDTLEKKKLIMCGASSALMHVVMKYESEITVFVLEECLE